MESWRTLSRRTILDYSKYLRVEEHQIELPDGQRIDDWPWVITPDYVNVVAITEAGAFLCFRQTKYGIAGVTTAIVGGYLEPGEEPLAAAQRELLEETGFAGEDWQSLGSFVVDANRGCGTAYFFLARGVRPVTEPDADDLEDGGELPRRRPRGLRPARRGDRGRHGGGAGPRLTLVATAGE